MRDDFEWDDAKAADNLLKHGVTFWLARKAFADPHWCEELDPDPDEERFNRLCATRLDDVEIVLFVTYTERGRRVRIVSAREATNHEQRTYLANRP